MHRGSTMRDEPTRNAPRRFYGRLRCATTQAASLRDGHVTATLWQVSELGQATGYRDAEVSTRSQACSATRSGGGLQPANQNPHAVAHAFTVAPTVADEYVLALVSVGIGGLDQSAVER